MRALFIMGGVVGALLLAYVVDQTDIETLAGLVKMLAYALPAIGGAMFGYGVYGLWWERR